MTGGKPVPLQASHRTSTSSEDSRRSRKLLGIKHQREKWAIGRGIRQYPMAPPSNCNLTALVVWPTCLTTKTDTRYRQSDQRDGLI